MSIPEAIQRRIDALERNNPDECEEIATLLTLEIGYIPSATAHYMFMLQDDASELRRRLVGRTIKPDDRGLVR
jgi:hypothetical protein